MGIAHPSGYHLSEFVAPAGEAITEYLLVTESGGETLVLDGGGDQAATQQLPMRGVAMSTVATGERPDVADEGSLVLVIAGTGGLAVDEEFVAENGTGRALGIDTGSVTLANGDYIGGRVLVAAAAGDAAIVRLNIRRFYENVA